MKLLSFIKSKKEKGATMVEYAILVALIAVVVIALVGLLGGQINNVFQAITDSLGAVAPNTQ
jgi:pilus assembly protein Flp/PilA